MILNISYQPYYQPVHVIFGVHVLLVLKHIQIPDFLEKKAPDLK